MLKFKIVWIPANKTEIIAEMFDIVPYGRHTGFARSNTMLRFINDNIIKCI